MKKDVLDLLLCPSCHNPTLNISNISYENKKEIRTGEVRCTFCTSIFEIRDGILNLLINPGCEIIKEQQGWTILEKAVVNTDESMLALPYAIGDKHEEGWKSQAENFNFIFPIIKIKKSDKVLDLGAGRCWATRFFAKQGCYTVGLDILLTKYVGLLTGDIYIEKEKVFFERICGSMGKIPFCDNIFNIIFMSATLHHSSCIGIVMKEISRILKPGGSLVLINEPVRGYLDRNKVSESPEYKAGINEHIYRLGDYLTSLKEAGLIFKIYPYISGYALPIRIINKIIIKIFRNKLGNVKGWSPLIYIQLLLFKGVLNLFAAKPSSNML
jgi:SAM-dependent methyltransferase